MENERFDDGELNNDIYESEISAESNNQNIKDTEPVLHRRKFGKMVGALLAAGAGMSMPGEEASAAKRAKKIEKVETPSQAALFLQQAQQAYDSEGATGNVKRILKKAFDAAVVEKNLIMYSILDSAKEWWPDDFSDAFVVHHKAETLAAAFPEESIDKQLPLAQLAVPEIAENALALDLYDDVIAVCKKSSHILTQHHFKDESRHLLRLSNRANELSGDYKKLHEKLIKNPDDPKTNTEMGMFYLLQKKSWPQALPCLVKGEDEKLAHLSEQLLNAEKFLTGEEDPAPADVDDLALLAQTWIAYGDAHHDKKGMKNAAYEAAVSCYLAIKDIPNNNPHKATLIAFLSKNSQKPIDFTDYGNALPGLNVPLKTVDLFNDVNVQPERHGVGWGSILKGGKAMKGMVTHPAEKWGCNVIPVKIDGDYMIDMQVLVGDQSFHMYQSHSVGSFHVSFPIKDHMLTLVMNESDVNGIPTGSLGGLSEIGGRRLPNGARYIDPLIPSQVPLNIRIKVSYRGDLADIYVARSDGFKKKWIVDIAKCRADSRYRDQNGVDFSGIAIGGYTGLYIPEMFVHFLDDPHAHFKDHRQAAAHRKKR